MLLFAVHISDGVMAWPWWVAGWAGLLLLMLAGGRRVADAEIPRIALLTAAFFVATLIRVPLGPTSVHLVLNGLLGVILGFRAVLAIAVGVTLHAILLGHGGYTSIGLNGVLMAVPALFARRIYTYFASPHATSGFRLRDGILAVVCILHAWIFLACLGIVLLLECLRRTSHSGNEAVFAAGFTTGFFSVLTTALLNALLLWIGGIEDWRVLAVVVFAAHLPVALVEGVVVGMACRFLTRVKPELLRDHDTLVVPE